MGHSVITVNLLRSRGISISVPGGNRYLTFKNLNEGGASDSWGVEGGKLMKDIVSSSKAASEEEYLKRFAPVEMIKSSGSSMGGSIYLGVNSKYSQIVLSMRKFDSGGQVTINPEGCAIHYISNGQLYIRFINTLNTVNMGPNGGPVVFRDYSQLQSGKMHIYGRIGSYSGPDTNYLRNYYPLYEYISAVYIK